MSNKNYKNKTASSSQPIETNTNLEKVKVSVPVEVGCEVKILGIGNTSAYGVGSQCFNVGKIRTVITKVPCASYPFKLGRYDEDHQFIFSGYYKEEDLQVVLK